MTAPMWHTATTPEALALHDATWGVRTPEGDFPAVSEAVAREAATFPRRVVRLAVDGLTWVDPNEEEKR